MKTEKINQVALTSLTNLKTIATENDLRPTWVLQLLLEEEPQLTRQEFRQTAEAAGFNGLTARNIYDKVKK